MIVIRWSRLSSSVCISGYIIKIQEDVKGGAKIERFVDANVDKFALTPLQSCRQYVVTMQAHLGRFPESKSPIFAGKNSEQLYVQTAPDPSLGPFELTSLQIRRGKTSITAVWKRQEWPCLFPKSTDAENDTDESDNARDQCYETFLPK